MRVAGGMTGPADPAGPSCSNLQLGSRVHPAPAPASRGFCTPLAAHVGLIVRRGRWSPVREGIGRQPDGERSRPSHKPTREGWPRVSLCMLQALPGGERGTNRHLDCARDDDMPFRVPVPAPPPQSMDDLLPERGQLALQSSRPAPAAAPPTRQRRSPGPHQTIGSPSGLTLLRSTAWPSGVTATTKCGNSRPRSFWRWRMSASASPSISSIVAALSRMGALCHCSRDSVAMAGRDHCG